MTLTEIEAVALNIKDDWRRGDRQAAVAREHIAMTDFIRALANGEVKPTVIAMGAKALLSAIEEGDRTTEARAMPKAWHEPHRTVRDQFANGHVPGAVKIDGLWRCPVGTKKPAPKRGKPR